MNHFFLFSLLVSSVWACSPQKPVTANRKLPLPVDQIDSLPPSNELVLLELFTSQGCSSCPPADRVLAKLNTEAQAGGLPIVALSYHVDYWNRLGWTDPYSQQVFSQRQRTYARKLADQRVYTPQLIINGRSGHVGSREQEIRTAVQAARSAHPTRIALRTIAQNEEEIELEYSLAGRTNNLTLFYALVAPQVDNEVPRGENRGRHLQHVQVVRNLGKLQVNNQLNRFSVKLASLDQAAEGQLVLFTQDIDSWEVTGVASVSWHTP